MLNWLHVGKHHFYVIFLEQQGITQHLVLPTYQQTWPGSEDTTGNMMNQQNIWQHRLLTIQLRIKTQ